jgi:hypothetical protein
MRHNLTNNLPPEEEEKEEEARNAHNPNEANHVFLIKERHNTE